MILRFASASACALLLAGWAGMASATMYELDETAPPVFGEDVVIKTVFADSLVDLARLHSLGYEEITRVNPGVDPWVPGEGTTVLLPGRRILPPGPREGIVINLPEHRLYYYPKPKRNEKPRVYTYPISVAKMDWHTPIGETKIVGKEKNPTWYPPESIRKEHAERGEPLPAAVAPGPDNPLGYYKMRLGIPSGAYLIHGTNNPLAVGMAVTHGCIRMYPEDIEELFPLVPVGTKVRIINEPVKVAYVNGELLLEAHPQVDAQGQSMEPNLEVLSKKLDEALGPSVAGIHWDYAIETLAAARGMPVLVGLEAEVGQPASDGLTPDGAPALQPGEIPRPADAPAPQPPQMPAVIVDPTIPTASR